MKTILALVLFFYCSLAFCQGEFIVEYKSETNSFLKVNSQAIDDVMYIFPGMNAYDENSGVFYFISADENMKLYGIDTETGDELYNIDANHLRTVKYSNSLDRLVCVEIDEDNNHSQVITINPITSEIQKIGVPIEGIGTQQGFDGFNDKDTVYTFTIYPNRFISMDMISGVVLSDVVIDIEEHHVLQHYKYDSKSGILYGLLNNYELQIIYLCQIDTKTGKIQIIGEGKNDIPAGQSSTINENEGHYIFNYYNGDNYQLVTLDLTDGSVVKEVPIYGTAGQDNLIDLEYDNEKNKLYSKHWDSILSSTEEKGNNLIEIYPNPASTYFMFDFTSMGGQNLEIELHDMSGNKLESKQIINKGNLKVEHLNNGIYILSLYVSGQLYHQEKLVIAH